MKIKLKDGKELELTEEVIQKVADLIIDSGDLEKPDYPMATINRDNDTIMLQTEYGQGLCIYSNYIGKHFGDFSYHLMENRWRRPFTGCIHYKNGKPVKTEVE